MSQITRREFLRMLAACSGALTLEQFLSACGFRPNAGGLFSTSTQPPPVTPSSQLVRATTIAASPTTAPTIPPSGIPELVVARGSDPETIVRRALAAFGGMEKFIPKDASVIIKPNICVAYHTYEYAATTNPWVVGALVKTCLEAGARSV